MASQVPSRSKYKITEVCGEEKINGLSAKRTLGLALLLTNYSSEFTLTRNNLNGPQLLWNFLTYKNKK